MGLLDQVHSFAQGASNGVAGSLTGPVDGLAWLLRKAGVPMPDAPMGGSDWMRNNGLMQEPKERMAGLLGEGVGSALPAVIAGKAPQIAQGLLQMEANAMAQRTLNPQAGKVLAGGRAEKMAAMDMEPGWFRGGAKINDGRRSGPWYTQDAEEAANYAKRFGADSDLREYAIPKSGFLNAQSGYSHKLPNDVARVLDDPYFGAPGASLAKELRTFGPGEGVTGGQLWQALESRFGNDGAAEVLQRLGSFKGVKGVTGGPEAYVFKGAPVRDANKAAFDPSKYSVDDIYGKATLPMLGAVGGTALGAGYLLNKE